MRMADDNDITSVITLTKYKLDISSLYLVRVITDVISLSSAIRITRRLRLSSAGMVPKVMWSLSFVRI